MINYLKKLLNEKSFGSPSEYSKIILLLEKDYYNNTLNYSSRLIRNFYNLLDIKIPIDFLDSIKKNIKLSKSMNEISSLHEKNYFSETPLNISIDELYEEYHYLNETNSSQYLYYINIINYSIFCVKHKSIGQKYDKLFEDILTKKEKNGTFLRREILSATGVNELLNNLLIYIIKALETFNYKDILILYKKYFLLPNKIYYPDDVSKHFLGGDGTEPLLDPYDSSIYFPTSATDNQLINWFLINNIFFYFSFNTINERQFSLFEFTNIVLVNINESKEVHTILNGMRWNLQHDITVHLRLLRASHLSLIDSYRIYKLLKYIIENETDTRLYIFIWVLSNEYAYYFKSATQVFPFNLYDFERIIRNYDLIQLEKSSFSRKRNKKLGLLDTYNINNELLLLLEKINIIKINDEYKKLMSNGILQRLQNKSKLPNILFEIVDDFWKLQHNSLNADMIDKLNISLNLRISKDREICFDGSELLIKDILKFPKLNTILQKDKCNAIERAIKRNNIYLPVELKKYLKYKQKYLNLKIITK